MTIPETVTSIGSQAFRNNADLSIAMSGNLLDNALFSDCENLRITLSNGSTFIKESALINCSGLIEIHIPNSVSSIAQGFAHLAALGITHQTVDENMVERCPACLLQT